MTILTRRAALLSLAPLALPRPLRAAAPPVIPGTFALPGARARVSATLVVSPAPAGAPPGTRVLDVAMFPLGLPRPVTRFDVELSKRMHLIAVSEDLGAFVHEHGDRPAADGHFRVPVPFPHGGAWHVYADAVPSGLGQQVMRFDVDLGGGAPPSPPPRAVPQPTGPEGSDGRYGIRFDALDLRAGQDAQLTLHVLRDGQPAPDLSPFLGVAAHAVFVSAADLTYVHVHAAPAAAPALAAGGTGAPMHGDMAGMGMQGMAHGGTHGTMAMGAPLRPGAAVPPDLALHLRVPKAGTYVLWLQFMAGGQVRTVRFVVAVA